MALLCKPLGEAHKEKISAQSLKFYSIAQANKVITLFIIWLEIGKVREVEKTSVRSCDTGAVKYANQTTHPEKRETTLPAQRVSLAITTFNKYK